MQHQSIARGALRLGVGALAGAALLVGATAGTVAAASTFTISGSPAHVLLPGSTEPLNLSVANPSGYPLTLSSLTVAITAVHPVSGLGCTLNDYAVTQYAVPSGLVIPGSTSRTLSQLGVQAPGQPQVRLRETGLNQNACEGATFDLAYTGTGITNDGAPATGSGGTGSGSDGSSDSDGDGAVGAGHLAGTGANGHATSLALAGVALVALGAGGIYAARRRKAHED